jgi:phosphoglycolate phosphatase
MTRVVIFDLDGTLADTLEDIAASMNRVLERHGYPAHPVDAYRTFVGNGARILAERVLGSAASPDLVDRVTADWREDYAQHHCDRTGPYTGVMDMLDALQAQGLTLAVLSNKPQPHTEDMVARLLGRERFAIVRGQLKGCPLKPDPTAVQEMLAELGCPAADCCFVGDTAVDMETAARAGTASVGVLWGFRDEAELRGAGAGAIIGRPDELPPLLAGSFRPDPRGA